MAVTVSFDQQLSIVQLAVTKTFNDTSIGEYAKQAFEDYEELDEVLEDLGNMKDSYIIHSVTEKIDQDSDSTWNKIDDEQTLHILLLKIFKDKIIDIDKLVPNQDKKSSQSLPKTLKECNKHQILYIATIISNDINKAKPNSINIESLEKLIITEDLNGSILTNLSAKDFTIKAKSYSIKAPKARKLFTSISSFYDNLPSNITIIDPKSAVNLIFSFCFVVIDT